MGRVATTLYALFGIPLCLVMMATIGRLLTRIMKYLWSFIRRFFYTGHCRKVRKKFKPAVKAVMEKLDTQNGKDGKSPEDGEPSESPAEVEAPEIMEIYEDDEFNLPPILAIVILVGYVLFGGGSCIPSGKNGATRNRSILSLSPSALLDSGMSFPRILASSSRPRYTSSWVSPWLPR